MSKYTTELRYICETYAGMGESGGLNNVDEIVEKSMEKLFDFEYPIFDADYRTVLQTKIVKHYYTREIGAETVGLWKLWLNTRLNEIMPYYNELYKSTLLEFNPFYDVDLTRQQTSNGESINNSSGNSNTSGVSDSTDNTNTSSNSNTNGTSWEYQNDTPQGGINGLETLSYLTSAGKNTNNQSNTDTTNVTNTTSTSNNTNTTSTSNNTNKNTTSFLESVKGKQGGASYAARLKEYRETFINIDMMVINELQDLFINLW